MFTVARNREPDDETDDDRAVRTAVRERYGEIARETDGNGGCCSPSAGETEWCDDSTPDSTIGAGSAAVSYDESDRERLAAADLGLGCGTPVEWADLAPGETVLDLGCGGGFDCLLGAEAVGPEGQGIGVDMTPEMVERARSNATENEADTAAPVSIRLGEIEHLPVGDERIDVVVSNCVVNLSPAKEQVFAEAFRALAPGGRVAIAAARIEARKPPASTSTSRRT